MGHLGHGHQPIQHLFHHLELVRSKLELKMAQPSPLRLLPMAKESQGESPNARGTALYLLCLDYLEKEGIPA